MRQWMFAIATWLPLLNVSLAVDTAADLAQVQGEWEVVELVEDGRVIPKDAIKEWLPSGGRIRISDNAIVFTSHSDGRTHVKVFSLDGTRIPKGIDITTKDGQLSRGIFRFDTGKLIVCLSDPLAFDRPSDFSAPKLSRRVLMVLQKTTGASTAQKISLPPPPKDPTATGTTAKVLTDAEVKSMLAGMWQFNDGYGPLYATLNADGTFHSERGVQEIQTFQTVFVRTPVSNGTWNVQNGQLIYYVASSTHVERAGRSMTFAVRSISARDLIVVDAFGRVMTAVKVR